MNATRVPRRAGTARRWRQRQKAGLTLSEVLKIINHGLGPEEHRTTRFELSRMEHGSRPWSPRCTAAYDRRFQPGKDGW